MSGFAPSFQFGTPNFAAPTGIFIAAPLLVRLRNHRRNRQALTGTVHRDKSEIGGTDMLRGIGNVIFHVNLYAHFHGCMKNAVHRRPEDHEVSDPDGDEKIDVIDRRGHDIVARMAVRSHCAGKIDPVHEPTAEKSSEWVCIVGQNDFRHFRLGVPNGTSCEDFV